MKKIVAFGASSSKNSINKELAKYAASRVSESTYEMIDLLDFEMPIYSEDREKESGIPQLAYDFYNAIGDADSIVMSLAEYNGSYTSAYKNLFDWTSRIDMKVFQGKPVLMLSTSPGPGGAQSVLAAAKASAPYFAANLIGAISLPNFFDNFDTKEGIVRDETFKQNLLSSIGQLANR